MRNLDAIVAPEQKRPAEAADHVSRKLKTLFIIVDSGMAIRNLLRTDVFKVLRRRENLRIVVFSPLTDEEFKREVAGDNVIVEPLQKWKPGPIIKALRSMRKDVWSEKHDVARFREKRSSGKGRLGRAFVYNVLSRDSSERRIDRALEKIQQWEDRLTPPLAAEYFAKYQPDLIFFSTIYAKDLSIEIAARQRGVKSCAYIVSWDNPTTKGPFPVRPDRAIVWNNIMRDELITYHEFDPDKILVSGPPQFDIYTEKAAYQSRAEFFRKWKVDPTKRLVTYTTGTFGLFPLENDVIEVLYGKVAEGAFKYPVQLMVRPHPKNKPEAYQKFTNKPDLILQLPGRRGKTDDSWNPSREDMYELGETMAYSDVIVNIASTTTIDAACFGTPVVNVAFDGFNPLPYEKSCRRIYDFNHYKKIVETGGVKIAETADETVRLIDRYLDDPALEAEGRARIRDQQCYKFDGQCGRRIAEYLIDLLEQECGSDARLNAPL